MTPEHDAALPEREALLPCPFCGGPVELERTTSYYDHIHGDRKWWGVKCRNTINLGGTCAIQQVPSASEKAAVTRWNTRAAIAQRRAQEWQPIETAPKDGTRILVWGGGEVREGWCTGIGTARDGGDVWRGHSLVPYTGRPTHWMPLPAAPLNKDATA